MNCINIWTRFFVVMITVQEAKGKTEKQVFTEGSLSLILTGPADSQGDRKQRMASPPLISTPACSLCLVCRRSTLHPINQCHAKYALSSTPLFWAFREVQFPAVECPPAPAAGCWVSAAPGFPWAPGDGVVSCSGSTHCWFTHVNNKITSAHITCGGLRQRAANLHYRYCR